MGHQPAKLNYMAVLPDGSEHGFEVRYREPNFSNGPLVELDIQQEVKEILRKAGITTTRSDPQSVTITVYALSIKNAAIDKRFVKNITIQPPFARMTDVEFNKEQDDLLSALPVEFRSAVASNAWERGHSAGLEEVLLHVDELVHLLQDPILKYTDRIRHQQE